MKKQPKISIIVPVYNVEQYISRCLESIIGQNYKNIEIVVVDDGSTDHSAQFIKQYEQLDKRIKYFYKENGGLSSARNFGLEKISGDYVMFVDSDDYLESNALQILTDNIEDYDIICFNYSVTTDNSVENYIPRYYKEKNEISNYILTHPSACTKLYRRDLFTNYNIRFDEGIHYEDLALIPSLARFTNKIKFLDDCLYHYYIRTNSIMHHNKFSLKIDDKFIAIDRLIDRFNNKLNEELSFLIIKQLCIVYTMEIINYGIGVSKPRMKKIKKYMKEHSISLFSNYYYKKEPLSNKIFIIFVVLNMYYLLRIFSNIKNKLIYKGDKR